nr:hypothetical protein [Tanacetum cinerariifolium]
SVQPFGSYLRAQFDTTNTNATIAANERALVQKYVYQSLYNRTQSDAQQEQVKDKFYLRGRFQGASGSDEISLPGIGVAQGSVKVYSGSTLLTEGVDYQVFYDQAKVKILNAAYLSAANELRIAFEKNALVQVQPRKLVGTRLDYAANKDALFGFTAMHILENQAPGINRVNIGDEPANNTMLGGDNGVSYIDDFENARTPYTLGGLASIPAWRLAATPAPILGTNTGLASNYRRGKLAWYTIDQSYYTGGNGTSGIANATLSNFYTRGIPRNEVFPNKDLGTTGNGFEYTFDLAYYPGERGPYNFFNGIDPADATGRRFTDRSAAANQNRFGGISRGITFDTDFDNANIEYL